MTLAERIDYAAHYMSPHNRFRAIRTQHLLEAAEDYTELVAELIEKKGEARVRDIARMMEITHVTALRSVQRLKRDGWLKGDPHRPIELTEKGKKLAAQQRSRHELIVKFLCKIGVPKRSAEMDAEGVEHHLSKASWKAIERFVKS